MLLTALCKMFFMFFVCQYALAQDITPKPQPITCDARSALSLADNQNELIGVMPEKAILVDLGAVWCSLCKVYSPTTKASAIRYGFVYVHIDWDKARDFVAACGIAGAPTYIVFNNGSRFRTIQLPQWQNQGGSAPQIDTAIRRMAQDLKIYP